MLSRWEPQIYSIFRIITGLLFMSHGSQKILGWPPGGMGGKPAVGSIPWVSGVLELVLGALIAVGLLASIAGFLASGEMAVAYFLVHAKNGFHPLVNQGEMAVLYCFIFLYVAARGSGSWSIDSGFRRGKTAPVAR